MRFLSRQRKLRRSANTTVLALFASLLSAGAGAAIRKAPRDDGWLGLFPVQQLSSTAWTTSSLAENLRYRLVPDERLDLLARFTRPAIDRAPDWQSFWAGKYGPTRAQTLDWNASSCGAGVSGVFATESETAWPSGFALWSFEPTLTLSLSSELGPHVAGVELDESALLTAVASPEPEALPLTKKRCAAWQRSRSVMISRYGAESDVFRLLECDGSVALDALDRLSVLARQPGAPKPELPLPLEPQADNEFGEWLPELKLVHPRLVWALQSIANAFPRRGIYLISGYRRDGHGSYHRQGRALDLYVRGIPNEELFRFCRTLRDVACGYYPNNSFVHVDVRPFGTGHPMWIDVSEPGKPSEYVDSWPGVAERGGLTWASTE